MDIKKKFKLNITTLIIIVIILSVLVYLSATQSPIQQQDQTPPEDPFAVETLFPDEQPTAAEPEVAEPEVPQETSEEEPDVIATITFSDSQAPEKQLQESTAPANTGNTETQYTVHLHASWSKRLHPNWYPSGAHISPMVVWSHRLKDVIFRARGIASNGMEIMAETGATNELVKEITAATAVGKVASHATGTVFDAPGENTTTITMTRDVPYITAVSMIAPSPDWFVAAQNIRLYENGRWLEQVRVPAVLYDAGTDSGTTFTAEDEDTNPQNPITKISNVTATPIATFEFIKN